MRQQAGSVQQSCSANNPIFFGQNVNLPRSLLPTLKTRNTKNGRKEQLVQSFDYFEGRRQQSFGNRRRSQCNRCELNFFFPFSFLEACRRALAQRALLYQISTTESAFYGLKTLYPPETNSGGAAHPLQSEQAVE